jgi:hypothetical protein
MEPIVFFIFIVIFWIPSVFLLVIGLVFHKRKSLSKQLYISSIVAFSIPWLIILGTRINEEFKIYNVLGSYSGKDKFSNNIKFEIKRNNECSLTLDHCEISKISGNWQYVSEYDNFLFYMDIVEISFADIDKGEIILNSLNDSFCLPMNEVILKKE